MAILAKKIGVYDLCQLPHTDCVLTHTTDGKRKWMLNDVVNVRHGSGLVLWMTPREQNIKPADGTEGAHSICADGMSLMQLPRAPQRLLRDYVRDFSLGDLDTTWWIHDMSNELVQMHPDICRIDVNLDVEIQCRDLWMLRGLPEHCRVTPIDPAPIFIALPRPHLIVTPTFAPFEVPILCHVTIDGRANLLSMVLDTRYPPIGVAAIFALAIPQNDCQRSECYLFYGTRRYDYWHDIEIEAGAFIRVFEWMRELTDGGSTSCASPASSSSVDRSWSSDYVLDTLDPPFDREENHELGRMLDL